MHHRLRLAASAAPPCTSLCVAFLRHINGLSRIGASARLSSLPSQQATSLAATVPGGADAAQRAGGMLARRSCFFSTSANSSIRSDNGAAEKEPKREYFIPTKRQYKSAPKRQHGIHAGWRKFSQPKDRPWHVKPKKGEEKRELAEVSTSIKGIRVSPWQLNLLAKVVRNLPVVDAVAQMEFGKKKHTETYKKIIQVSFAVRRDRRREVCCGFPCCARCMRSVVVEVCCAGRLLRDACVAKRSFCANREYIFDR